MTQCNIEKLHELRRNMGSVKSALFWPGQEGIPYILDVTRRTWSFINVVLLP